MSEYREELITIGRHPWTLPGTLTLRAQEAAVAAVVLVHGSGPHDRDESVGGLKPFRDLACGLASRRIAVLRYEKRTRHHASLCAVSRDFTVKDETVDDAVSAIELLRNDARLGSRIVVLGHSLGGMLAPRIAVEAGGVAGLVLLAAPSRPLPHVVLEQVQHLASLTPLVTPAAVARIQKQVLAATTDPCAANSGGLPPLLGLPMTYWQDLRGYDPLSTALSLAAPMLILQGGRDCQVTATDLDGWQRALQGRSNVTIRSYPRLNHFFIAGVRPSCPAEYARHGCVSATVISDIADWVSGLACE